MPRAIEGVRQMEQIKENKMGTNPVFRLIISMSLPAIFSMLIQSMYNICLLYTSRCV